MEAKYIIGDLPAAMGSCLGPIIFPAYVGHNDVARMLGIKDIVGAGFCSRSDKGWSCWGESTSLKIKSRGEDDSKFLNRMGVYY